MSFDNISYFVMVLRVFNCDNFVNPLLKNQFHVFIQAEGISIFTTLQLRPELKTLNRREHTSSRWLMM